MFTAGCPRRVVADRALDHPQVSIASHVAHLKGYRRRVLQLVTTLTHFGTAVDVTVAELRLEAFPPADEATAAILGKRWRSDRHHGSGA
jgi:hypothetical protein